VRLRRRVARIMRERRMGEIGYRMPDGSVKYIRRKDQLDAFYEACEGADTPRARIMLQATECITSSSRIHEFAQSLIDGPTVQHQPQHPEKETIQ
jgi:hypothetical protein